MTVTRFVVSADVVFVVIVPEVVVITVVFGCASASVVFVDVVVFATSVVAVIQYLFEYMLYLSFLCHYQIVFLFVLFVIEQFCRILTFMVC